MLTRRTAEQARREGRYSIDLLYWYNRRVASALSGVRCARAKAKAEPPRGTPTPTRRTWSAYACECTPTLRSACTSNVYGMRAYLEPSDRIH